MAIDKARSALIQERDNLRASIEKAESDLGKVEKALAALGDGSTRRSGARRQSKWTKEQLTCDICGFVAKAPQGLAAHKRRAHGA